jgi:hypothetical protein
MAAFAKADALDRMGMGTAPPGTEPQQLIAVDRKASKDSAPLQRETSEKNLAMFEYVIAEAASINQLVAAHIQQKEAPAAQALKDSLTLKALSTGKVSLNVAAGAYVLKGTPVFEVK